MRWLKQKPSPHISLPKGTQSVSIRKENGSVVASTALGSAADSLVIQDPSMPLFLDELVEVTWEESDMLHRIPAKVSSTEPQIILNALGEDVQFEQRRVYRRFEKALSCQGRAQNTKVLKPGQMFSVQTVDISLGGVRFSSSLPFAPHDIIELIFLPADTETEETGLCAQVLRIDNINRAWRNEVVAVWKNVQGPDKKKLAILLES